MATRKLPWKLIIGCSLVGLVIAVFASFQFTIHALKGRIEKSLGPLGEVKEINIGLSGIEIIGLRIKAPPATEKPWPAEDQLRAERILIEPSFLELLFAQLSVQTIRIEGAYIALLRTKDGQMRVLPSLLESSGKNAGSSTQSTPITIGNIELVNGIIEFYDASIRQSAQKIRIEQINASIRKIRLPDLSGQTTIDLTGIHKGVRQDGKITLSGSAELANKESGLSTRLRGIDLVAFQPYLLKAGETGVKKGLLDLDLNSSVRQGKLHAPGTLTISDLELQSTSTSARFMGMPRNAVISTMQNRDGTIPIKFILDGDINDPKFSLNDKLATRIGASMASSLGLSIEGLAKGVGSIGSGTAKGMGDGFGKLFN
ncbi:MAG: DUF748 domain-containing protein [Betaproteobacteria bacterium]